VLVSSGLGSCTVGAFSGSGSSSSRGRTLTEAGSSVASDRGEVTEGLSNTLVDVPSVLATASGAEGISGSATGAGVTVRPPFPPWELPVSNSLFFLRLGVSGLESPLNHPPGRTEEHGEWP
jgi:hypothetical protein